MANPVRDMYRRGFQPAPNLLRSPRRKSKTIVNAEQHISYIIIPEANRPLRCKKRLNPFDNV